MILARKFFSARLLAIVVAAGLKCLCLNGQERYGFAITQSYNSEDIGTQSQAYCALEYDDGSILFGSVGLLRFDGAHWTQIGQRSLSYIYSLVRGQDGRIWAGGEGDIGWFEPGSQWAYHSIAASVPKEATIEGIVLSIVLKGEHVLYCTSKRVYDWDGNTTKSWPLPEPHSWMLVEYNERTYVYCPLPGQFYELTSTGIARADTRQIAAAPDATVLWFTTARLAVATGGTVALRENGVWRNLPSNAANQLHAAWGRIAVLPDGLYALATMGEGLLLTDFNGNEEYVLDDDRNLASGMLYGDSRGGVWSFSYGGITRVDPSPNTRVFDRRSHVSPQDWLFVAANDHDVSIANIAHLLRLSSDRQTFTDFSANIRASGFSGLTATPDEILVANMEIDRLRDGKLIRVFDDGRPVTLVARSRDPNRLFTNEWDGEIYEVLNGKQTRVVGFGITKGPESLVEDTHNRLWVGTTSGALVINMNRDRAVRAESPGRETGLPTLSSEVTFRSSPAADILAVAAGQTWMMPHEATSFSAATKLPDVPITAVSDWLPDNSVWVVHGASGSVAAGVGRLSLSGRPQWSPHDIPDLDVVGIPRNIAAQIDEQGRTVLWITGSKSVLRHVVEHGPVATRPGRPLLRAFVHASDGSRVPLTSAIPYSTAAADFEFALPDFVHQGQLRYQTRLDGIDADWVTAGRDARRELTGLRDGKFRFEVRVIADTGLISEPAVFEFQVLPPWWRSPVAVILEAIAVVLLGWAGYHWRVRTLRRRNVELEEKVRVRTEELAEASAAKTQFVANMSHDIRNPLNGIVGLALALEDTRLDKDQRELIATLRECTTYLSSLVDDVLDFASIEAGRIELRPAPFVAAELLNSVVTTLKAECRARGAFVTIETDPEVPRLLLSDAGRIQQILVNYVSNALKYAGGHIRLSASIAADSPDEIEFAVADDGPGMSAEERSTLFTKFTRLADARERQIKGTGLGLASCRVLADLMGGSVGVDSEPGKGSRFFLRLPLVAATEIVRPSAAIDAPLPPTTVLLVEDTDYNALAATAVLKKLGLPCDRARNGAEALAMFSAKRHAIVLLDRNLPDMDGTEIARQFRALEMDGAHALLLAVTAYCTDKDRALCLEAGMDAFVGKPLTPDKLRRVLFNASQQGTVAAPGLHLHAPEQAVADTKPAPLRLDLKLLDYLAQGTAGGLAAQIDRFIAELTAAHADLDRTLETTDLNRIAHTAHQLLGHARMVDAATLIAILTDLETAARRADRVAVESLARQVSPAVAALTAAMRHHASAPRA